MGKRSRKFTFTNSAALYSALQDRGVPEERLEEAAEQVAQQNELDSASQVRPEIKITFPDKLVFGSEVVFLSDKPSLAQDFRAKTEAPRRGKHMGAMGIHALRDRERATSQTLEALREALDPTALRGAIESAHQLIDGNLVSGVPRDSFLEALAQAEVRLDQAAIRYRPGRYTIPGGGQVLVRPGGEFSYQPVDGAEAARLQRQGFVDVGEGAMLLPPLEGAALRQPGAYPIPGDIALVIGVDGALAVDAGERSSAAMQAAGSELDAQGLLAAPQRSGSFRLPGGTSLEGLSGDEVLLDPGRHDPKLFEQLGFTWDDDEGMLRLPARPGAEALRSGGEYALSSGTALRVLEGGDVLLDPGLHDPAELLRQGFTPVGSSGLLRFPTVI